LETQLKSDHLVVSLRLSAIVVGLSLLFSATTASALPRYTARYGQDCTLCHANPTGGGLRTLYASQFLMPNEMAMKWLDMTDLEDMNPQVGDNLLVGADLRTLFTAGPEDAGDPKNFFQMQSDLYLQFNMGERFSLYMDRGQSNSYESFGLAYILPLQGYVKVGRFTPAMGWKFADHNTAVRKYLGFFPPGHTDVGMEFGLNPENSTITLAILNGNNGSTLDSDTDLRLSARAEWRVQRGPIGLAIGANFAVSQPASGREDLEGVFGYLTAGDLIYLGEVDIQNVGDGSTRSLATSHELSYPLVRGLDLIANYSFWDPDTDLLSGSDSRSGAGVDALVHPFFGVKAMWQYYSHDGGSLGVDADFQQLELIAHFLY
jgi:hypothetical protein